MKPALILAVLALGALSSSCSSDEASGTGTTGASGAGTPGRPITAASSSAGEVDEAGVPREPDVEIDMSSVKVEFGGYPRKKERIRSKWVALGRRLYHDPRLSRGKDVSCATCHDLQNFGQDGKVTSAGTGDVPNTRNTPTVFNAARQFKQFWDYRADTVEQQATMQVMAENAHGLTDEAELVAILEAIPEYAAAFEAAFPRDEQPISAKNVGLAIGNFERELTTRSRWDDFVAGDESALTTQEKRGLVAFKSVGCTTCHMTRLLGGSMSQKVGLVRPVELRDKGRFELTEQPGDIDMFKVPQLLNVAETAPYMHDGAIATLEESVRYMVQHQLAVPVSEQQITDMVAFLGALTGELENPELAGPPIQ